MDISNYNVKDTTKCECGLEFNIHDIDGLKTIDNHGFFSNIARTCSQIRCPKCKKETVLLLRQKGQTWQILGIATKIEKKQPMKTENKAQINLSNELVCPICQKACKNKLGLNAHMKTHNK